MFELFDLENLKLETPETKYKADDKMFKVSRDANGNGEVRLRILPDPTLRPFTKIYKVNPNIIKNGQTRFASEVSPQSVGKPCPFQEHWADLWNGGNKDEARKFSRSERYVANVYIVNDTVNPENNGTFKLFEFPKSLFDQLMGVLKPSSPDIEPQNLFLPVKGNTINIKMVKKGGIPQYEPIQILLKEKENPFDKFNLKTEEEWKDFLEKHTTNLEEWKTAQVKSYEELKEKLNYVLFKDLGEEVQEPELLDPNQHPQGTLKDNRDINIDDFLDSLK